VARPERKLAGQGAGAADENAGAQPGQAAGPRSRGYRFDLASMVVVDDNKHIMHLIAEILRGLSVSQVERFTNAPDALAFLREQTVDLVITDHHMDMLSGIEFVHLLRNDKDSLDRFVPIIMVTGYGDVETVKEARDAGVNEFVVKPLTAKALYLRILEIINCPRPFVRTATFFGPDRRRRALPLVGPDRRRAEPVVMTAEGEPDPPAGDGPPS
jgi:CheY-like chemotaxis protein